MRQARRVSQSAKDEDPEAPENVVVGEEEESGFRSGGPKEKRLEDSPKEREAILAWLAGGLTYAYTSRSEHHAHWYFKDPAELVASS